MAALLDRRPPRYPFDFSNAEKPYESYNGLNVRLRYFIRVTVTRGYPSGNLVKEQDFVVQRDGGVRSFVVPSRRRDARARHRRSTPPRARRRVAQPAPEVNNTIKMEVGIEECLHIEFEYDKTKYHLNDIIIGKVYFLLVRIKIKHMELAIIRREAAGSGPQMYNDSETITKFEVMDGAPVRGECIPIRLFLSNFVRARRVRLAFCFFLSRSYIIAQNLTPTYRNINNKFNVRYYLNLVLVDQEERRYFKQQEITLYRAAE